MAQDFARARRPHGFWRRLFADHPRRIPTRSADLVAPQPPDIRAFLPNMDASGNATEQAAAAPPQKSPISGEIIAKAVKGELPEGHPNLEITEHRVLGSNLQITGAVNLNGIESRKTLRLVNCDFGNDSVDADNAVLDSIELIECTLNGIYGNHLTLRGDLDCTKTIFLNEVWLPNLAVQRDVNLSHVTVGRATEDGQEFGIGLYQCRIEGRLAAWKLTCYGTIAFANGHIGGNFALGNAHFENKSDYAIFAHKADINGSVGLNDCTLNGRTVFSRAIVSGSVSFTKTRFESDSGTVLDMFAAEIDGPVTLQDCEVQGVVSFFHTHMSSFSAHGASFKKRITNDTHKGGIDFECAKIETGFWLNGLKRLEGQLDLRFVTTGIFADDGTGWPDQGELLIDHFKFDRFYEDTEKELCKDPKKLGFSKRMPPRLFWLMRQPEEFWTRLSKPQPWRTVVSALRDMDNQSDASVIAKFARSRYRRRGDISRFEKVAYWLEAYPLLITTLIAAYVVICGCVFQSAYERGFIIPTEQSTTAPPEFNAPLYTADVFVPVIDFGQRHKWEARSTAKPGLLVATSACERKTLAERPASILSACVGNPLIDVIDSAPAGLLYFQAVATAFSWLFLSLLLAYLGGWAQSIFRPREDITV
jgi:hypothetical protein